MKKIVSGITLAILLTAFILTSNGLQVKGASSTQIRRFRFLGLEQMFDHYRMRSAQYLIEELLKHPNWNNSTADYVSYIHLLTLYDYNEVPDDVKTCWRGILSPYSIEDEMTNFLGEATPGDIVVFYVNGHNDFVNSFLVQSKLFERLTSEALPQVYVTVILDTCSAAHFIQFLPDNVVLAACKDLQTAWGGDCGFFTMGLIEGFQMANETNGDGWLSAAEVFPYAKNWTETFVTWDSQNPESYYGVAEGDLPLIQMDKTLPFPTWDVGIVSVQAPVEVEPESYATINVTVENHGAKPADFDVKLYVNSSLLSVQKVKLSEGDWKNITFVWHAVGVYGRCALDLNCTASACPGEVDLSDNVYHECPIVTVAFKTDLNLDGKVDGKDLGIAAAAFASCGPDFLYPGSPPHPRWNPVADENEDGKMDGKDLGLIASNFGKTYT